jgi:DNA-binding transcriptional ArsR family regulator
LLKQFLEHEMTTDQLTETFAALANPTRRAMLDRLAQGDATVAELAEPLPISTQAVSQHLKVLERSGLVVRSRRAQLRPSRLQAAPLAAAVTWLEHYRAFWESSLDRLEERVQEDEGNARGA